MDNDTTHPAMETQPQSIDEAGPKPKPRLSLPPGYIVLWLVTILSLMLNVMILRQVALAKQVAQQAIDDAIIMVGNLQDAAFTYTAVIEDTIPINADLELNESISVPVDETLPVDAAINVPVDMGPLGTHTVTLPVSGTVPVNTTLKIVIDQPLHVSTTIPVNLEVPIEVAVEDTPLKATLDDVIVRLEALALRLDRPLLSFGQGEPEATPESTP